jgi:photosystem II stability/assembly factor-like uncharacterized protein
MKVRWLLAGMAGLQMAGLTLALAAPPASAAGVTSQRLTCNASMSSSDPGQGTTTYVLVRTAGHAAVTTVAHFKTGQRIRHTDANAHGRASVAYAVGDALAGYRVRVTVAVRLGQRTGQCSTWFTPRAARPVQSPIEVSLPDYVELVNAASCPTASDCFAVGQDELGDFAVIASTDGGQTWRSQALPYREAGALTGISCPTRLNCWAIGNFAPPGPPIPGLTPLYATSNGGQTWTAQTSPIGDMTGISCPTALDCWVVGKNPGDTATGAIAATTDGGKTWTAQAFGAYSTNTTARLTGVSCPTTSHCWAAGDYVDNSTNGLIIATTDGGRNWVQQAGNPYSPGMVALTSISCPTVQDCVSVGDGADAVITRDGGSTWSPSSTFPFANAVLTSVSCPSATDCWAVGYVSPPASSTSTPDIVASTDGGADWHQQRSLPASLNSLTSVSCGSTTHCLVAGSSLDFSTHLTTAVAWATADGGGAWNRLALPASAIISVSAVSCPTANDCWAVGQTPTHGGAILATTSGGTSWVAQTVPSGISDLTSVYCPSATDCWAGSSAGQVIATTDRGVKWAAQTTPHAIGGVTGISCPTSSDCQAVTAGGVVIATVNGGMTWTYEAQPPQTSSLSSVSCPTVADCWTITGSVGFAGIDATTNGGTTWTAQTLPSYNLETGSTLTSVSCPTTSKCWVTGFTYTSTGTAGVLLETTDGGSTWAQEPVPANVGTLTGISCPTSSYCQAVGSEETNAGVVLVTSNGGVTWQEQKLPPQLGDIAGVSCPGSGRCQVVGQATAGGAAIAAMTRSGNNSSRVQPGYR